MNKGKVRWYERVLSIALTISLMMSGYSVDQLFVSAAEITGYQDEAVVRFRNAGSGKYLNVHNGQNANGVNVYQWSADGSTEQKFKLRYNLEEDCYMIGAMCSSSGNGRVLDIVKSGGQVVAGCNVEIYNAVDPVAQQWQFSYHENGMFIIFPVANCYLALTANGNSNGSGSGRSVTSAGNVYLSEIPMTTNVEYSLYQLWYIEEVEPQQTLTNGLYRITNDNDSHMTLDVDDDHNVCQVGNVSNLNTDEWSKTQWRQQQLWYISYLHSGYYLIAPYKDTSLRLSAFGDYEALQANVYTTYENYVEGSWSNRQQWKIVPNADGAYRIVSKGSYDSQAVTVYQGDTDDFINILMVPFYDAPGQRWSFKAANSALCDGVAQSISGHTVEYDASNHNYECVLCDCVFVSPEIQDFDNHVMTPEDRALIYALQRAALYEQLEGTNEAFVQSCYSVIDQIRSTYNGGYRYDFCDADGNYVSPIEYKYTDSTVNTRLEITVRTQLHFCDDERGIIWRIGEEELPFPFDAFVTVLMDYFEEYEWCSLTEGLDIVGITLVEDVLEQLMFGGYEELNKAISYASILNVVGDSIMNEEQGEEIHIQISMQSTQETHNFSGIYRVASTHDHSIYVVKEAHVSSIGQAFTYEANEVDCTYYSKEGYYDVKPYDKIF